MSTFWINPENPFVQNEYYFVGRPDSYVYQGSNRHIFRLIHYVVVSIFGLALSGFVFFLILKKSPASYQAYRKMFLMTTTVDTFVLIQFLFVQLRTKSGHDFAIITLTGLGSRLSYSATCPMLVVQTCAPFVGISMLAVQCYYRYHAVKHNKPPSNLQIFICFIIGVGIGLISSYYVVSLFCYGAKESNPTSEDFGPEWYSEVPIPRLIVGKYGEKSPIYFMASTSFFLSYIIAILFTILTMRELRKNLFEMAENKNAQAIQKQLTKSLYVQFCIPLLTAIMPRFLASLAGYLGIPSEFVAELSSLAHPWFSILNFLCTIFFIHPYRNFTLKLLFCTKEFKWKEMLNVFSFSHMVNTRQVHPVEPMM